MTKAEKAMNRCELKSFKNFETVVHSMLPGLQSDSPAKQNARSSNTSPNRFATRHLMAPHNVCDNSLGQKNETNEVLRVKPPF